MATRASGGISQVKINGLAYDAVSGSITAFNTEKTPVTNLSGVQGYMEKFVNPSIDVTLQTTSKTNNPVLVNELQNLTGEEGQDVVVITNNGVGWLLERVYVEGNTNYDIDSGEISFKLNGQALEQLYDQA